MKLKLFILLAIFVTAETVFNCNRDNFQCLQSSTCNAVIGECTCTGATSGKDCGIVDADIGVSPCVTCSNGGTCTSSDGLTTECHCTDEYFGSDCQFDRYEVTCTAGDMTVKVTPHGTFTNGFIFPYQKLREPSCFFTLASGETYTTTLTHSHLTCGNSVNNPGDGSETRKFFVVFEQNGKVYHGEMVTASCTGISGTITSATITQDDLPGILGQIEVNYVVESDDVEMTATNVDGSPISGSLMLGDEILVTNKLSANGLLQFKAMRVESCEVNNGVPFADPGYRHQPLITSSCQPIATRGFFTSLPSKESDTEVKFTVTAVKFHGTTTVELKCSLKVCAQTTSCEAVQCDGESTPYTGYGKRKRDANAKFVTTKAIYTVLPYVRGNVPGHVIKDGASYLKASLLILIFAIFVSRALGHN